MFCASYLHTLCPPARCILDVNTKTAFPCCSALARKYTTRSLHLHTLRPLPGLALEVSSIFHPITQRIQSTCFVHHISTLSVNLCGSNLVVSSFFLILLCIRSKYISCASDTKHRLVHQIKVCVLCIRSKYMSCASNTKYMTCLVHQTQSMSCASHLHTACPPACPPAWCILEVSSTSML